VDAARAATSSPPGRMLVGHPPCNCSGGRNKGLLAEPKLKACSLQPGQML